jgi:cyanophycinase-like exopeptidase
MNAGPALPWSGSLYISFDCKLMRNFIVVHHDKNFQVIGTGAVYVVDGSHISFSGLSDHHPEGVLSLYGVQLHVLAASDKYDLQRRCPVLSAARKQAQA